MQKFLLLCAASAATMSLSSQHLLNLDLNAEKQMPKAVSEFLSTPMGKQFTAEQVMQAMKHPVVKVTTPKHAQSQLLLHETFNGWTAGTNDAPDTEDVGYWEQDAVDAICDVPGWVTFQCYQAGGAVYQGFDEVGEDGPGYLMTPDLDLSKHQGVLKFKARVKNVNADHPERGLQYFLLNNTPGNSGMFLANTLPMSTEEYTEVEFQGKGLSEHTAIMFYSWSGKVLVDEVTVEEVLYNLETPSNIKIEVVAGNQIKVSCDPVEGAATYTFSAYSRYKEDVVFTAETNEPSAIIEGQFTPSEDVIVSIVASNDEDESYPGVTYDSFYTYEEIDAPVALEATNITNQGFTANWTASLWANTYELNLMRTHTVGEGGEEVYYMQEDFSEVPYTSDDTESTLLSMDGTLASLDGYINAKGWGTYLASCAQGMLALTNMYEMYGIPGVLVGPMGSYTSPVTISGMGASMMDDVVITVGFAKKIAYGYQFIEGTTQELELSTSGNMFEFTIDGGTDDCCIFFQITDADPSGDMAVFFALNIASTLEEGTVYTAPFGVSSLPATETSYDVVVDFPEGDSFTYSVVAAFGEDKSAASDVITVNAPSAVKLDAVKAQAAAEFFTLDGRRVAAKQMQQLREGAYIMRQAGRSAKVMK